MSIRVFEVNSPAANCGQRPLRSAGTIRSTVAVAHCSSTALIPSPASASGASSGASARHRELSTSAAMVVLDRRGRIALRLAPASPHPLATKGTAPVRILPPGECARDSDRSAHARPADDAVCDHRYRAPQGRQVRLRTDHPARASFCRALGPASPAKRSPAAVTHVRSCRVEDVRQPGVLPTRSTLPRCRRRSLAGARPGIRRS